MTTPILISDHLQKAKDRLLYQFKTSVYFQALLDGFNVQIQELENMFLNLLSNRWIETSVGNQLDRWGTVLDEPRFGLADSDYRVQLIAKVAQNNSEATPEDLVSMFQILTRARYIVYTEYYPAEVSMTAVDANPIGDTTRIRLVLNKAKPAGVEITAAAVTNASVFSFDGDTDPQALGFGDLNNLTLGGQWAALI